MKWKECVPKVKWIKRESYGERWKELNQKELSGMI